MEMAREGKVSMERDLRMKTLSYCTMVLEWSAWQMQVSPLLLSVLAPFSVVRELWGAGNLHTCKRLVGSLAQTHIHIHILTT